MSQPKLSFNERHPGLMSSFFIGVLGSFAGFSVAYLGGLLILRSMTSSYDLQPIPDYLADSGFFIGSVCCGFPFLVMIGIFAGLLINKLGIHYQWSSSASGILALLVSFFIGAVFSLPWNAVVMFSVIATGGLE